MYSFLGTRPQKYLIALVKWYIYKSFLANELPNIDNMVRSISFQNKIDWGISRQLRMENFVKSQWKDLKW